MRLHDDTQPEVERPRRSADEVVAADLAGIVARMQQTHGNRQTQRLLAASRRVRPRPAAGPRLQRLIKSVDIHGETATTALFWLSQGRDPRTATQIAVIDADVTNAARAYAERTIAEAHAAARGALQHLLNALAYVQKQIEQQDFGDPLMGRILERLGGALGMDSLTRKELAQIYTPMARAYEYLSKTGITFDAWNESPSAEATTVAWSTAGEDHIHLMTQFYLSKQTATERGLTIVHEIMHILDPKVAHNLDHLGWFHNAYAWEELTRRADAIAKELIEQQKASQQHALVH